MNDKLPSYTELTYRVVRDSRPRRPVYLWTGEGDIRYVGHLDDVCHHALVRIAGSL